MMEVFSIFIEVCAKIALILDCAIVIVFMVQLLHLVKRLFLIKKENEKKEYKDEILCTVGGIILFVEMGVLFVFCLILC